MDTQDTQTELESPVIATSGAPSRRFRIPGDQVNKATADLPDNQRSAIRWLHAYAAEHDLSLDEVGKLIRYEAATISKLFSGKYEAKIDGIIKEIEAFRTMNEARSAGSKIDFVETELARKIWDICGLALECQRIGFIFGETQIGKSAALMKYRDDHNHGSTIYVSMPTGGAHWLFVAALAKALRISPQLRPTELIRRIKESFDDRMLLIVDEAHQCLFAKNTASGAKAIEFVREIFEESKCGVIISATNLFREEMDTGRFAGILKQSKRRRMATLQLPAVPTTKDLNTFAAAYGLSPATGEALNLQTEIIREEALGFWLTLLRLAKKMAHKKHDGMSWNFVIRAHAGILALEGKPPRKEVL